jgi:hypothetical protein
VKAIPDNGSGDWPDPGVKGGGKPMTPAPPDVLAELSIAQAIIGPRNPVPETSPRSLQELRVIRWGMATEAERKDALWAARAISSMIAERERHVAEAVRERAAEVAGTGFAEDAPDKIRTLDLSPILKPEKSNG